MTSCGVDETRRDETDGRRAGRRCGPLLRKKNTGRFFYSVFASPKADALSFSESKQRWQLQLPVNIYSMDAMSVRET